MKKEITFEGSIEKSLTRRLQRVLISVKSKNENEKGKLVYIGSSVAVGVLGFLMGR